MWTTTSPCRGDPEAGEPGRPHLRVRGKVHPGVGPPRGRSGPEALTGAVARCLGCVHGEGMSGPPRSSGCGCGGRAGERAEVGAGRRAGIGAAAGGGAGVADRGAGAGGLGCAVVAGGNRDARRDVLRGRGDSRGCAGHRGWECDGRRGAAGGLRTARRRDLGRRPRLRPAGRGRATVRLRPAGAAGRDRAAVGRGGRDGQTARAQRVPVHDLGAARLRIEGRALLRRHPSSATSGW